jgi:hypothetical protein
MVTIEIQLDAESYDCLLENISLNSPSHPLLKNGVKIAGRDFGDLYVIVCNEIQAQFLLETAKQLCPMAVPRIETKIPLFKCF